MCAHALLRAYKQINSAELQDTHKVIIYTIKCTSFMQVYIQYLYATVYFVQFYTHYDKHMF